jgi:2,5-dihydroxypyridine 5,6-dioxygenase
MIRLPATQNVSADLVHLFRQGLAGSKVREGESVIVYADTFTAPQYSAAFLAAARDLGAEAFQMVQPLIPFDLARGVGRARPTSLMIEAMKGADFVVDVTTGGMLYSNEQTAILAAGTRILRVREPEDCLLRMLPSEEVKDRARRGAERFSQARQIRLVSPEGTDLVMDKTGRPITTQYGMADEPGRWDHWPTGLICTTPREETVEGTLVITPASIVFPFETYVTEPLVLRFEKGVATSIEGGREAIMLNDLLDRGDRNCRRLAHVGWGLEHRARWDTLATRGWDNGGGVESRSICGGVLIALGENRDLGGENAAPLHIDVSLRRTRLELDGDAIVENGRFLAAELG